MLLRVTTANLNGIRAAARKGFYNWMIKENPDVVCVQEVRAHMNELNDPIYHPPGYFHFFFVIFHHRFILRVECKHFADYCALISSTVEFKGIFKRKNPYLITKVHNEGEQNALYKLNLIIKL